MSFKVGKRVMIGPKVYLEGEVYPSDENTIRIFTKLRIPFEEVEDPKSEETEDLESLKVEELRDLAEKRGLDHKGLKKPELVGLLKEEVNRILAGE